MLQKRSFWLGVTIIMSALCADAQVNLQTGSAVFSLPMFNWQDDKSRLTSMVALSYNSGNGLKVNDLPSNVGQDWSLIAGGSITRMQVGEPDDQVPYHAGATELDNDITKIPPGILYSGVPAAQGCPSALTKYPIYGSQNVLYGQHNSMAADRQLDYFAFQFNGKTGMFILDTVGGDHGVPIGDTKLKITFQRDPSMAASQGIRTSITSFTIQDADGLIYKFTTHGLTKVLRESFCRGDHTKALAQPKIENAKTYYQYGFDVGPVGGTWINSQMAYPYVISNWYLTEIDDPLISPTRKITINYNTAISLDNFAGADISYNNSLNSYMVVSYKRSVTKTPDIASIVYPDGHQVNINYSATTRYDYQGERAVASVDILYQGRYLSKYLLNTTYFIQNAYGTPTSSQQSQARLCLKSVKKIGVDLKEDTPPYIFDYYLGSNTDDDVVPALYTYSKDVWGYYNGTNNIPSNVTPSPTVIGRTNVNYWELSFADMKGLCFQNDYVPVPYLNAKPNYAQNGLLKQIIYPTGGSLTYTYAQNTGTFTTTSTQITLGGVHVSKTSSSDAGYSNGCGTPIETNYNYVVNGPGSASSIWGVEAPLCSIVNNNFYAEEKQTIHWAFPSCVTFCCRWHYVYPGIISQNEVVSLEGWQAIMVKLAPVLSILSTITDILDIVNVCVDFSPMNVVAVVLDIVASAITFVLSCEYNTKNTPNTIWYNFDLNAAAPLPAQFKQVEVTESSGTAGKTVQKFTHGDSNGDTPDYPLWSTPTNNSLAAKQRFAPWAYGLPKLTTVYDKDGNKIKETQNVYDFTYAQETISDPVGACPSHLYNALYSCKCNVYNNYSQRSDSWGDPLIYNNPSSYVTSSGDMYVDIYNFYSGRVQLAQSFDRVYRVSDVTKYTQTETDYYYNAPSCGSGNYDVNSIVTTQSNGDINYKNIKYSYNYNTGVLATLVANNMSSVQVSTNMAVTKAGGGGTKYLSEKVIEFSQLSNGDIRPYRTIEQRFATPASSLTYYSGPTTTNYSLYKIPQVFTYDANSNLIGLKDEGSRNVSNIYDYNDKYIVASVINADPSVDKPAYTSFETTSLGGWTLSGTAAYSTTSVISGSRGFILSGKTLSASLNTAKSYIVSFWANASGVTITGGATLKKTGPTYLGMTYYEYAIALGTAGITISGTPVIDELRLYPANSRMRTTTYDPLLGKTSECDENNRIIYYVYDNLGRLRFTEDENQNIVKMNEYNNVSSAKQIGCPTSFANHIMSVDFVKNNCSAGYQGSTVSYIIPANTYTSSLSQQDADVKAAEDGLINGQNYANTNGTCSLIYYNTTHSETDSTQSCADGFKGGFVTYTVLANTYSSILSQADADQQALDDIAANAISYANNPPNAICVVSTDPDWEWSTGDSSYCLSVGGNLPPHVFKKFTDFNPNSATYNQQQWEDGGPSSECPSTNYYNAVQSGNYTRNNCGAGYIGTTVTYYVPNGKYSSTTSQAAANTLATNDVTANGQTYANTNGGCMPATITITYSNSIAKTFPVSFTNVTTGTVYNFTANSSTSGTLGTVPNGTYNISASPAGGTGSYYYSIYGYGAGPVTFANFYNVPVTSNGVLVIH